MKQDFKIGYVLEGKSEEFYNFFDIEPMTISKAINTCKDLFDSKNLDSVCLGYDWCDEINIVFHIDKDNTEGILEVEAKLMIKDEFKI